MRKTTSFVVRSSRFRGGISVKTSIVLSVYLILTVSSASISCAYEADERPPLAFQAWFACDSISLLKVDQLSEFAFTALTPGGEPESFVQKGHLCRRITDDHEIQYATDANARYDTSYAVYSSGSAGGIFLNDRLLLESGSHSLFSTLGLGERDLVFAENYLPSHSHYLHVYDISSRQRLYRIPVTGNILSIHRFESRKFIIEIFDLVEKSVDLFLLDSGTGKLQAVATTLADEIYSEHQGGMIHYYRLEGSSSLLSLHHALALLFRSQPDEAFSGGNNFRGRVSWVGAFRLLAWLELYQAFQHPLFLQKAILNADLMLKSLNQFLPLDVEYSPWFMWARMNSGTEPWVASSHLVDQSLILYSLLKMAKYSEWDPRQRDRVKSLFENHFEWLEINYLQGHYRFPRGMPFWADGIWMPFNYQNTWGLSLSEFIKNFSPTNKKYQRRLSNLCLSFDSEIENSSTSPIWHYWPQLYYQGWTASQNLSEHTPEKAAEVDFLFEDNIHAALSVEFMAQTQDLCSWSFPLHNLQATLGQIQKPDHKFSRFISGDTLYQTPSFHFFPTGFWLRLRHSPTAELYQKFLPSVFPHVDAMELPLGFAIQSGERIKGDEILKIFSYVYNPRLDARQMVSKNIYSRIEAPDALISALRFQSSLAGAEGQVRFLED